MAPWWRKNKTKDVPAEEEKSTPAASPSTPGKVTLGNGTIIPSTVTLNNTSIGSMVGANITSTAVVGTSGHAFNMGNVNAVPTNPWIYNNVGQVQYNNAGQFTIGTYKPATILVLTNQSGEIVRLNIDGSVTWANGINVDEAAKAFEQAIKVGAELQAGITKKVKSDMRDTVFEEIIEMSKTKGSLTFEELTFMYESSKIMEKLRGGRE